MSKVANPFAYLDAFDRYINGGNTAKCSADFITKFTRNLLESKDLSEVDKYVSQIQRNLHLLAHAVKQEIEAEQELKQMKEE